MPKYRIIEEKEYPRFRTGNGAGNFKVQKKGWFGWKTDQELVENELNMPFDFAMQSYDIAFETIEDAETYVREETKVVKYL